jgi:hypothetical protein
MRGTCALCGYEGRDLDITFVAAERDGPLWPEVWCAHCIASMEASKEETHEFD